jgi:uncharacterized membrane protein YebE (DUF533 family)
MRHTPWIPWRRKWISKMARQLRAQAKEQGELAGLGVLLYKLIKNVLESGLEADMNDHPGVWQA